MAAAAPAGKKKLSFFDVLTLLPVNTVCVHTFRKKNVEQQEEGPRFTVLPPRPLQTDASGTEWIDTEDGLVRVYREGDLTGDVRLETLRARLTKNGDQYAFRVCDMIAGQALAALTLDNLISGKVLPLPSEGRDAFLVPAEECPRELCLAFALDVRGDSADVRALVNELAQPSSQAIADQLARSVRIPDDVAAHLPLGMTVSFSESQEEPPQLEQKGAAETDEISGATTYIVLRPCAIRRSLFKNDTTALATRRSYTTASFLAFILAVQRWCAKAAEKLASREGATLKAVRALKGRLDANIAAVQRDHFFDIAPSAAAAADSQASRRPVGDDTTPPQQQQQQQQQQNHEARDNVSNHATAAAPLASGLPPERVDHETKKAAETLKSLQQNAQQHETKSGAGAEVEGERQEEKGQTESEEDEQQLPPTQEPKEPKKPAAARGKSDLRTPKQTAPKIACVACRERHRRCSRDYPCEQCAKEGEVCKYGAASRGPTTTIQRQRRTIIAKEKSDDEPDDEQPAEEADATDDGDEEQNDGDGDDSDYAKRSRSRKDKKVKHPAAKKKKRDRRDAAAEPKERHDNHDAVVDLTRADDTNARASGKSRRTSGRTKSSVINSRTDATPAASASPSPAAVVTEAADPRAEGVSIATPALMLPPPPPAAAPSSAHPAPSARTESMIGAESRRPTIVDGDNSRGHASPGTPRVRRTADENAALASERDQGLGLEDEEEEEMEMGPAKTNPPAATSTARLPRIVDGVSPAQEQKRPPSRFNRADVDDLDRASRAEPPSKRVRVFKIENFSRCDIIEDKDSDSMVIVLKPPASLKELS